VRACSAFVRAWASVSAGSEPADSALMAAIVARAPVTLEPELAPEAGAAAEREEEQPGQPLTLVPGGASEAGDDLAAYRGPAPARPPAPSTWTPNTPPSARDCSASRPFDSGNRCGGGGFNPAATSWLRPEANSPAEPGT